jgi:hypothetical protein
MCWYCCVKIFRFNKYLNKLLASAIVQQVKIYSKNKNEKLTPAIHHLL